MSLPPLDIPAGLEGLLPAFIAEMAKDAARLQALAGGDRAELAEHAHAMRGKCAMFGERILFDQLTLVEMRAAEAGAGAAEIAEMIGAIVERSLQLREYAVITDAVAP